MNKNIMLSLYLHIPYCVGKCPYCGFYSTKYTSNNVAKFIAALRKEAISRQERFCNRLFHTIYIGGGTPSVLSDHEFAEILNIIKTYFLIADKAEFTVEANPQSAVDRDLTLWRTHGVNRLSLGVQSFSHDVLRTLGRLHTAVQAKSAFLRARSAGFRNIGMDLMYGIPGQTDDQWRDSLDEAITLRPEHLSIYSLSLDEGSVFTQEAEAGRLSLPDDAAADMYGHAVTALVRAGYRRYEISNLSLPEYECRHNLNYWQRGEYLGLGPGAWSFLSGTRTRNVADVNQYIAGMTLDVETVAESETPGIEESSRETILLSLRTAKGLDLLRYRLEYGPLLFRRLESAMLSLVEAELIHVKDNMLTLTDRGILLSNETLLRLSI